MTEPKKSDNMAIDMEAVRAVYPNAMAWPPFFDQSMFWIVNPPRNTEMDPGLGKRLCDAQNTEAEAWASARQRLQQNTRATELPPLDVNSKDLAIAFAKYKDTFGMEGAPDEAEIMFWSETACRERQLKEAISARELAWKHLDTLAGEPFSQRSYAALRDRIAELEEELNRIKAV